MFSRSLKFKCLKNKKKCRHENKKMLIEEVMLPYVGWYSIFRCTDCSFTWADSMSWKRRKELGLENPPLDSR